MKLEAKLDGDDKFVTFCNFALHNTLLFAFFPHYEITPMQYTENFFNNKNLEFHWKNSDNFNMFAPNVDCGYTLEPPC